MGKDVHNNSGDFLNKEDILSMRATFLSNIENSHTEVRKRKAFRNRLFFEIGISLPVSVSTLLSIKWNSVLKDERLLNESIVIDDEEYPISGTLGEVLKQYINVLS